VHGHFLIIFVCAEAILIGGPHVFHVIPDLLAQIMFWSGIAGLIGYPLYQSWKCRHWIREHVEPWHVIAIGLAIAGAGLLWQVFGHSAPQVKADKIFAPVVTSTPPDVASIQSELTEVRKQLVAKTQEAESLRQPQPSSVPNPPLPKRIKLGRSEANDLIVYLRQAKTLFDDKFVPIANDPGPIIHPPGFAFPGTSLSELDKTVDSLTTKVKISENDLASFIAAQRDYRDDLKQIIIENEMQPSLTAVLSEYKSVLDWVRHASSSSTLAPEIVLKPHTEKVGRALSGYRSWVLSVKSGIEMRMNELREDMQ
jgi:hypothetical protein